MAQSVQLLEVCTKSARYFPECIRSDVVDHCEYHYCTKRQQERLEERESNGDNQTRIISCFNLP